MKILIVNTFDIQGGAARAAYRLHKSLLSKGIDSQMLVQRKSSDEFTIISDNRKIIKGINALRPTLDHMPIKFYRNRTNKPFSIAWLGWSGIVNKINEIQPDIVHLHWIYEGMLGLKELTKIEAPIVFSLHDMWAFTGGCHYTEGCESFQNGCGSCKLLGSFNEHDLSSKIFMRKKNIYDKIENMTIVGLSFWMHESAKKSKLLENKKHINIPNPINTDIFKPFDKEKSRRLWNLPQDKKLVLFGAMGATSDPRKGFKELSEALHKIEDKNIELVVFGSSEPKQSQNFGFKAHYLGYLHDNVSLVTLYSAVDVMVVPSLQEAFGQTASEAMSCDTPVVAFAATGLLDIVDHKINGYLAKPFDTSDLANGIEWILNNEKYNELCQNAREKVLKEFDSKIVAQKYIELYKDILKHA